MSSMASHANTQASMALELELPGGRRLAATLLTGSGDLVLRVGEPHLLDAPLVAAALDALLVRLAGRGHDVRLERAAAPAAAAPTAAAPAAAPGGSGQDRELRAVRPR